MAICSPDDVRAIAMLSTDEVTDAQLNVFIDHAQKIIIGQISSHIVEEKINTIDSYRENTIDGSNTSFFTKNSWSDYYTFDEDGDGVLSTTDMNAWLYESSDDTRTEATLATINENGNFTLDSAPESSVDMTISYRIAPVSLTDPRLKVACEFLAAAFAFTRIRADEFDNISLGSLRVSNKRKTFDYYHERYLKIIDEIKRLPRKSHRGKL